MRIQAAIGVILGCDPRILFFGRTVFAHMAAGEFSVEIHEHAARFTRTRTLAFVLCGLFHIGERLLHQFDIDRTAECGERFFLVLVVELLHAQSKHDVVHTRSNV